MIRMWEKLSKWKVGSGHVCCCVGSSGEGGDSNQWFATPKQTLHEL